MDADKRCRNCNEMGHIAKNCDQAQMCNLCGSPDHMAKDCASRESNCEECGKRGHAAARCRMGAAAGTGSGKGRGKGRGGRRGNRCYNCLKDDHVVAACPEPTMCHVCGDEHKSKDCPIESAECSKCGKTGHMVARCYQAL